MTSEPLFPSVQPQEPLHSEAVEPLDSLDGQEEDEDFLDIKKFYAAQHIRLPFKESLLPSVIRENVVNAPRNRKMPVLIACLAPLCAIASRIRLRYKFDRTRMHALLVQVIIEGEPGVGKGFAAEIVEQIITPTLEALDERQRRTEQEYREKKQSRTQNEEIGTAPKTTIRCIPPATSKTVIVKRSDYYKRILDDVLTFWMWAEELAQITDAGKSSFSNLRTVMRIAYDLGSKFGQDFASDNSYSGIADVLICSMFCATPQDVDDYMDRKSVMGGNCNRLILCELEDEPGAKPAIFRPFSTRQQQLINLTLEQMMADTYDADGNLRPIINLDMQWMDAEVDRWTDRSCREVERLKSIGAGGWKAMDTFRKRCSVNAFRCTGLFYYLYLLENRLGIGAPSHVTTEEEIRRRCIKMYRFLADYNLRSLLSRWGNLYEAYHRKRQQGAKVEKTAPLFEQLTHTFTRAQIEQLVTQNELDTEPRFFLSQWKSKGWIKKLRKGVFEKLV